MSPSPLAEVLKTFRVWIRPVGDSCRMRVEGADNAQWLLQRMSAVAICPQGPTWLVSKGLTLYSFELKCLLPMNCSHVEQLLKSLPAVELVTEPVLSR